MIFPEKVLCWKPDGTPHMMRNLLAESYNELVISERNKHPLAQCEAARKLDELVERYERTN